ncbi:MAG: ABC transporter substrate-binding protein [Oscillospiraceae bacterium]|nr:ABC transporter substrate-binding protein [Oscillospiraceae bacterium]
MKKLISLLMCLALALGLLAACGETNGAAAERGETVTFTDSAGRRVEVPAEITRVAPSGAVATMFLASVCPEYMVCIASTPSSSQYKYFDPALLRLPTTGQLYGSKSTINLESLMSADPQVIIDLGDSKDGIGSDMNALQKQTGIPTVFIEADLAHMAQAFRMLGELLYGKAERCEELAAYVEETVSLAEENALRIPQSERARVMYTTGVSGLNTNAEGSTQAQVIGLVGAVNAVTVDDVSNKGGGNPINMEQLYIYDPDVILFAAGSMYADAADDPAWSQVRAVREGRYYEIPALPYNWMSSPPSLNMLLGIRWLGNLLYPDVYDYDMAAEAQRAYKLLWDYELGGEEAAELLSRSTLRETGP